MNLLPGKEYPEINEKENTEAIISAIKKRLQRDYSGKHTNRQFHAKMHACIKATFNVDNNLDTALQVGIFKPGKSYDCWIRFSNGNTKIVDDRKADLRGMAIKLLNVEGEQLVKDSSIPYSHDFVMVSYPTLMSATVKDFRKSIEALCNGLTGLIFFGVNPLNWPTICRTIKSFKKHRNLFSTSYWSVSPYRFGSDDVAVKYKISPTAENLNDLPGDEKNFLGKRIAEEVEKQNITFDFLIQFQENANVELVENPTKEWQTPFKKLGMLVIPKQKFNPETTKEFGDNLTFSPWHCTSEHRPLGAINRARKETYKAISEFRVSQNKNKSV